MEKCLRKELRLSPRDLANLNAIKTAEGLHTDSQAIRFALEYCRGYVAPTRKKAEDIIESAKQLWEEEKR